jgi:hypothetical protein
MPPLPIVARIWYHPVYPTDSGTRFESPEFTIKEVRTVEQPDEAEQFLHNRDAIVATL